MSKIIVYLDVIGPLVALPFYFFKDRWRGKAFALLLYFLVLQVVANGLAKMLMLMHASNNIYVYQANAFFSCIIVSTYILEELKKICSASLISILKIYAPVSYGILLVITLLEDTSFFNSLSYTFTGFTICVFCVLFYLQSLANLKEEDLIRSLRFWAVTAFFLYYSISFFIFMYYKIFTKLSMANFQVLWGIHNFVLFLSCFILIIAGKQREYGK